MQFVRILPLVLTFSLISFPIAAQDGFSKAKKRYVECMGRLPLLMKTRGREALATCGDPRALQILSASYRRPGAPVEQSRAIIVSLCARNFSDEEFLPALKSWRESYHGAEHAWLWYRVLSIRDIRSGPDQVIKVLEKEKDPFLRAAALESLRSSATREIFLPLAMKLLSKLPRKDLERSLILEALAARLLGMKSQLGQAEYDAALERLILQLDEKRTPRRSRLVISRFLAAIFNSESHSIKSAPWLLQMKAGRNKALDRKGYGTTFFDIQSSGDRISYVIDMSDSMLTPLPKRYQERGRTTGTHSKRKRHKKFDPFVDEYQIPWHRVKNRFDLAREHIKLSLYGLKKDKSFAIIGFGTPARLFDACPGMIPATKSNIKKVIKALDAIRPGPKVNDRPHGTLWGYTNLHGGLLAAFSVKHKGLVANNAYVSPRTFKEGSDTIYVLSDGDPTWDNFDVVDKNYGEDQSGDPESRSPVAPMDQMHYPGPYRGWKYILEDVKRMNLFRKAEIHCIGIGDVQAGQLARLAHLGLGKSKMIGH